MRAMLLVSLCSLFATQAFAKVCIGDLTVDNIGNVTVESATLYFLSPNEAAYTGPHASVNLGEKVKLDFSQSSNGWLLSDLSSKGHFGETNLFWVKDEGNGKMSFIYQGSFNYTAKGELSCQ